MTNCRFAQGNPAPPEGKDFGAGAYSTMGECMKLTTRVAIAAACALSMTTVFAQTVQRGETAAAEGTQAVAQASTTPRIQTAQAGTAAGGASGGASTGGALGGVGAAGTVGSAMVFVGAAVAGFAAASSGTDAPVAHLF